MWRGPVVQAKKNLVNAIKWKVFSLHAKLISIAAQKWGDPEKNPSLFTAVHKARKEWVPNENIERAIKKWTWEDKTATQISEIIYEWYAPGGVSVMVSALTDNKNRTVQNIKHIFTKYGWNMGETWAVSWMFHRKWVIFIDTNKYPFEQIEEIVYETKAEDFISEEKYIKIITSLEDLHEVEKFLEDKWIEIMESKSDFIPDNDVEITEFDKALKFKKMIDAFDEDEDVQTVSSNEIISDELSNEVDEFIEKNTFKT